MKRIISILLLTFVCVLSHAETKVDTFKVDSRNIVRVIEDKTTNTQGKVTTKYYFMMNNRELISTSKSVVEKYNLCKKYNALIALALVKRGSSKRIILN